MRCFLHNTTHPSKAQIQTQLPSPATHHDPDLSHLQLPWYLPWWPISVSRSWPFWTDWSGTTFHFLMNLYWIRIFQIKLYPSVLRASHFFKLELVLNYFLQVIGIFISVFQRVYISCGDGIYLTMLELYWNDA